jgi:hypothetical protein
MGADWVYYAYVLIAAYLVATALAPKPVQPKPVSLEDFDVPTAEQGREIAVVFGTVTVTGPNVIWYGNLSNAQITKEGGKK